MSLLREIENGSTDATVDISTILRKAKILAARLKNQDLADWLERELNGYPDKVDVPDYRMAGGPVYGEFALPFQQLGTQQIPASVLPPNLRHWAEKVRLREPIATYSALLARSSLKGGLQVPWPTDMARLYGSKAYENVLCLKAWIALDSSALAGMLDSVRNRLLSFTLAIERENPDAGEAAIGSTPVEPAKVAQYFQTFIYGGTNNVAAGASNFSQRQESVVHAGDFQALRRSLESAGAESEEIKELESELTSVETSEEKQRVADGWLGGTTRKAVAAARAFMVEVSAKAIAEYFRPPGT